MVHNIFLTIEKYMDFNCDLIPNSDVCTIKIKGNKGETGQVGDKGYIGLKGTKGDKGLSGFSGLNGKEIPNIEFKELNTNILLGEYKSYDSKADTKTIHINKGSIGNTAYIPALKFIYNDLSELYINPNNSDSDSYIEVDLRNVKGIKGDTGDDGYCTEALKGDRGDNGTKGPQGVEGEPGKDGPMGDPGNDGPLEKNPEYKNVNSELYCFYKNGGNYPICISTDNNNLDRLDSLNNIEYDRNSIVSTSTSYSSEPSPDSIFSKRCIKECNKITSKENNSGGCDYFNNVYVYMNDAKEDDISDELVNEMLIDNSRTWIKCANEGQECTCTGNVYYGKEPYFSIPKEVNGKIACNNDNFGDSYEWVPKECYCDYNSYPLSGKALNFNDKINSIRLPPKSHISYFEHGIGDGQCFDMRNDTNKSKRLNVEQNAKGKISGIRYGKTCSQRPQIGKGTPPAPFDFCTSSIQWSDSVSTRYFDYGGYSFSQHEWRLDAWQLVKENGDPTTAKTYIMIIYKNKLYYAGYGQCGKDGESTTEIIVNSSKTKKHLKFKRIEGKTRISPAKDNIHLGWITKERVDDEYFKGPLFYPVKDHPLDQWTKDGKSYSFEMVYEK